MLSSRILGLISKRRSLEVEHGRTAGIELDLVLARRRKAEVAVPV
jgi:hypothetical protein